MEIKNKIHYILMHHNKVNLSQLHSYLNSEGYRISKNKLKHILIDDPNISMSFLFKTSHRHFDRLEKCVVCGCKTLIPIYETTLLNQRKIVGRKCKHCGAIYKGRKTSIYRYVISLKA